MKKSLLVAVLVGSMVVGISSLALAYGGGKCGCSDKGKCEMLQKVKMIILNKAELGLTEQQVEKLADIKHAIMKDSIMLDAQVDVIAVDIKTLLGKDTVDVAAVKPLVDKASDLEKEKTMKCIQAFADAKKVLTPEQNKKMKEICFEAWKSMGECRMGKKGSWGKGERGEKK